jgi:hypothetical protein
MFSVLHYLSARYPSLRSIFLYHVVYSLSMYLFLSHTFSELHAIVKLSAWLSTGKNGWSRRIGCKLPQGDVRTLRDA